MNRINAAKVVMLAAVFATADSALSQCTTIDFEDLAVGTVVTTQYDGVTFSAQPQSCGGSPTVNLIIRTPTGGTSSGTKGLGITTGCPDFSPDYIRIVFDNLQQEVTFTVGDTPGTYQVRAYTAAGGVAAPTQNIVVGGAGFVGVHYFVRVLSGSVNIKRIEIDDTVDDFETIDDLAYDSDTTPPDVDIAAPSAGSCFCGNSITLTGIACDPDTYDHDMLEYMPLDIAGSGWSFVSSFTSPQCTPGGILYLWNTAAIAEGTYVLKVTARNECGLEDDDITTVRIDRTVDTPVVRSPLDNNILGGVVCVDGTVRDDCYASYRVDYKPAVGGAFNPVNPATPVYAPPGGVINDPLASWDTRNVLPAVTDGNWQLRVRATNTCGANSADVIRTVTIDNTAPVAVITDPVSCAHVEGVVEIHGTANDAHLAGWTLQYTGGDEHGWVTIASGNAPVIGGVLGNWNTAGLPICAYTLRLVVSDAAVLDCNGVLHNQAEYHVSVIAGECPVDLDGDGDQDLADFALFQNCFGP